MDDLATNHTYVLKILGSNAVAIVLNFNGVQSVILKADLDRGCIRIQTIFNKLLDNRVQVYNDLAGLNLMDLPSLSGPCRDCPIMGDVPSDPR